jgi:hypothetical protein
MVAAWRKAGLGVEDSRFEDAADGWERERADAEELFGRRMDAGIPWHSGDGHERRASAEASRPRVEAFPHRRREPGGLPTLHDELAGLVWRVFIAPATPVRSLMFCGAAEEQPSNEVGAAAAELLAAHHAGTVCLVDTTGAAPSLDRRFTHTLGFADTSADLKFSSAERQASENLWLVASGSPVTGGGDRPITNERLRELGEQFDYVIVVAPAVLAGPEALAIAAGVEGVILLIAENTTRRDAAQMAIEHLEISAGRVLGVMLTNRSYPIPSAIYRRL